MKTNTHIGAYAVIENDGKIVLIKKGRGAYTGKLDLPGGRIEHGEKPEKTLVREVKEEVGVNISNISLLDVYSNHVVWEDLDLTEDLHHIGIIYQGTVDPNSQLKKEHFEDSLGSEWYEIDSLDMKKLSPFAKKAIKDLKTK